MSNAMPDILAAALTLSDGDRAVLAYELLGSLKPPSIRSDDDEQLSEEFQRRLDAYEQDPSRASDLDDVDRRIRTAIQQRRQS
jgi:putative addiction module component (TIGR02574 family)